MEIYFTALWNKTTLRFLNHIWGSIFSGSHRRTQHGDTVICNEPTVLFIG